MLRSIVFARIVNYSTMFFRSAPPRCSNLKLTECEWASSHATDSQKREELPGTDVAAVAAVRCVSVAVPGWYLQICSDFVGAPLPLSPRPPRWATRHPMNDQSKGIETHVRAQFVCMRTANSTVDRSISVVIRWVLELLLMLMGSARRNNIIVHDGN